MACSNEPLGKWSQSQWLTTTITATTATTTTTTTTLIYLASSSSASRSRLLRASRTAFWKASNFGWFGSIKSIFIRLEKKNPWIYLPKNVELIDQTNGTFEAFCEFCAQQVIITKMRIKWRLFTKTNFFFKLEELIIIITKDLFFFAFRIILQYIQYWCFKKLLQIE